MAAMPVRVAVISRNPLIRAGIVGLISTLNGRAVVTRSAELGRDAGDLLDVAIYDLGAVDRAQAEDDLHDLIGTDTPVIGLTYESTTGSPISDRFVDVVPLSVTSEELLDSLARSARPVRTADARLPGGLTEREFGVLVFIAQGLSNQQIADHLYLSANSVKTYIRQAYRKIHVTTRVGAVQWAQRHGLGQG
jgi:DNA-binding NarL/FixJ family response regulator